MRFRHSLAFLTIGCLLAVAACGGDTDSGDGGLSGTTGSTVSATGSTGATTGSTGATTGSTGATTSPQTVGDGSIPQTKCGNGVIEAGEECDWNPSTMDNVLPSDSQNCAALMPGMVGELWCDPTCKISTDYCQEGTDAGTYGG